MRKRIGGAKGTYFTPEQVSTLLTTALAHSERDWLLILVTVTHGLRASEALSLTPADIRDGCLWVARIKGSKRTCQPLTDAEREPLLALAASKGQDERLFPISRMQFWRIMRATCRRAGLEMIAAHPHSLKHSMCRAVLADTGNLRTVQVLAGHSSITSTLEYTHQTDAEASAAAREALMWGEYRDRQEDELTFSTTQSKPN
jgi:integrase